MLGFNFSAGYMATDFRLEEYTGEKTIIDETRYNRICGATEEAEPLMVKVDTTHFPVYPSNTIPHDVMAIPKVDSEELDDPLPAEKSVLVPKGQDHIRSLF